MRRAVSLLTGIALAATGLVVPALPAAADHGGATIEWSALLPPLPTDQPLPDPATECGADGVRCALRVERRLGALEDRLGCDHRAVFATTYRLLTRELRRTLQRTPGIFDDPAGLGLEAEGFVSVYFDTFRDYQAGKPVPEAWRIAFDAAAHGDDNAGQDMLLAINAHVQHDMPFVVAEVGLRTPDGTSRKHDHDVFNRMLSQAYDDIVPTVGRRYDPFMTWANASPSPVDNVAASQLVEGWREGVWRNAERLAGASSPAERAAVAAEIDANATAWARMIDGAAAPGYRAFRDAYCAAR